MNKRVYVTGLFILQCSSIITLEEIGMEKIFGPCTTYEQRHEWYQYYDDKPIRTFMYMNISGSLVSNTNFILYLEPFDNNSIVRSNLCLNKVQNAIQNKIIMLSLGNDEIHSNATIKKYSDTGPTAIKCDKYKNDTNVYVNMGTIKATSNQITTYASNQVKMTFNRSYDNAVVYCLYYVRTGNDKVINVTRYVTKTLLVYDDLEDLNHEINGQQMYVIAFGVIIVVALVTTIAILYRSRCRKKIENDADRVSYVELDVPDPVINLKMKEESPYAQIIGEIKAPKLDSKPTKY
ncbi:unnamed protein product [Spodoptera littoralis]|uniref:Uncharacterized protein n=1 Tax=Spodoptera littoralis TaxID=7109 RepID=A0A9P0I689_SPOLI|nr:unnamed protein product [Spodoptera littoralis]CAH1640776.1 unnamed protein product [Spodoptera littoralis]